LATIFNELKRRQVFRVAGIYAVVGWVLLQIANMLESAIGLPDWFDGMVVAALIIGFPVAILLAWAYELTAEGVKRTEAATGETTYTSSSRLEVAIVAGLAIVIGMGVWQQITKPETVHIAGENPAASEASNATGSNAAPALLVAPVRLVNAASIAVLPFADLSPDKDQEYFSDGISEEILNVLVGVDGLSVASRTSAFRFKGESKSIPTIASELKVAHVLEGSVRKAGETIRITAQLIRAEDDVHLWSDTYDRELTVASIFEIQDDIAEQIVASLSETLVDAGLTLNSRVAPLIDNFDAYELYQQATNLGGDLNKGFILKQIDLLEQATAIAPGFAEAWSRLALYYSVLPGWSPEYDIDEMQVKAMSAVEKSLALKPDSPYAMSARGRIHASSKNWAAAMPDLQRGVEGLPYEQEMHFNLGLVLLMQGYAKDSLAHLKIATELDPANGFNFMFYGMALAADGQLDAALQNLAQSYVLDYRGSVELELATIHRLRGDRDAYRYAVANMMERANYADLAEYVIQVRLSPEEDRVQVIERFWQVAEELGYDQSEILQRTAVWGEGGIAFADAVAFGHDEVLAVKWPSAALAFIWGTALGSDGRKTDGFKEMMRIAKLPAYWRENGWPDKCRPAGDNDFVCD
jgi:TolB-like protein/Tfp pilus assembly protein PilF